MNLTSESRTMEFAPKLEDSERVYRVKFQMRDYNRWKEKTNEDTFKVVVLNEIQCKEVNQSLRVPNLFNKENPMWRPKKIKGDIKSVSQTGLV